MWDRPLLEVLYFEKSLISMWDRPLLEVLYFEKGLISMWDIHIDFERPRTNERKREEEERSFPEISIYM